MKATEKELKEEDRKIRWLRIMVDLVCTIIIEENTTLLEARRLVAQARQFALKLFPGQENTYDIIYQRRFNRLLAERFPHDHLF